VIGTVAGIALPFGVPCSIEHRTADGDVFSRSEQFKHDAFAESIERGGQVLKIDHAATVPGVLTLFEGPDLRFRFRIHDSVVGLRLLDHVRRGEARGASIAFRARRMHYGFAHVEVVEAAELNEVSICLAAKPAWYGTAAWEEV
jgi:phage head maturation protease